MTRRIWFGILPFLTQSLLLPLPAEAQAPEETHTHEAALKVETEDPVLKEQILKVHQALAEIHTEMARRRKALQQEQDPARKASLYQELDLLQREHDTLERILHELVWEATATEWTAIDEALKRAKQFEHYQEKSYQKEEAIRDRQQ